MWEIKAWNDTVEFTWTSHVQFSKLWNESYLNVYAAACFLDVIRNDLFINKDIHSSKLLEYHKALDVYKLRG